ncbi:MAG: hypothetical protein ACK5KT_07075 [Dysgonomonas sp.]
MDYFSIILYIPEPVDVRIVAVKEPVNDPRSPEITIANNVTSRTLGAVINEIPTVEQTVDRKDKEIVDFTKRRFRDVQETITMLEEAQLNFSESINPIAVQTMLALIGDNTLQFRFVDNKQKPNRVPFPITYNIDNKTINVPAGILQHMTIGIDSISSSHEASEYHFWDMAGYISGVLTDAKAKYYLYAKVEKTGSKGTFLISDKSIAFEEVAGYYHLLVGAVNSEFDGVRSYVDLYSYTEILPGRITTDRIVSSDGNNFMDFVANAFKIGNESRYLAWNVISGLLEIMNASLQIKNKDGEIVSSIDGETGAASFGKGAHKFNADGSLDLANGNILFDLINGLLVTGRFESNKDGRRIVIDPQGSLKMIDSDNSELVSIFFDSQVGAMIRIKSTQHMVTLYDWGLHVASVNPNDSRSVSLSNDYISLSEGNGTASFSARIDNGQVLDVRMEGLPTDKQGLGDNRLWRNGEDVKIKAPTI